MLARRMASTHAFRSARRLAPHLGGSTPLISLLVRKRPRFHWFIVFTHCPPSVPCISCLSGSLHGLRVSNSHTHIINQVLGQLIHSYNSLHSSLSSFRIAASMARKKKGHKSVHRIAPNNVFRQVAQRVRYYQFLWNALPIAPATVRLPERVLPPLTISSFSTPAMSAESASQQLNRIRAQQK